MTTTVKLSQTKLTRRQFLRRASIPAAAFMVVPGAVLGLRGATSPNAKLNLAGIGVGGQGASDLSQMESENIVALCDVDKDRAGHIFRKYPKAQAFTYYRQMLDRVKEIDGVVIATPDQHHAYAAMEAIRRGKHVYCKSRSRTRAGRRARWLRPPTRPRSPRKWATRARRRKKRAGCASMFGPARSARSTKRTSGRTARRMDCLMS